MAAAGSFSCSSALTAKFTTLSLNNKNASNFSATFSFRPLTFSAHTSLFSTGTGSSSSSGPLVSTAVRRPVRRSIVCEAAPKTKPDSAVKRARQAEKRRVYNKSRKSEVKTRMKKVLEALDDLRKKPEAQSEEIFPIEKLIGEAYSVIDKAVKVGTLHRNTGARRKSRLARRKKAVEIHHGWYAPVPVSEQAAV